MDPLSADRRSLNDLPDDFNPLLATFLAVTSLPNTIEDAVPIHQGIRIVSGDINDNWSPSLYQLWKGQDLHSLVYLRKALSNVIHKVSVQQHLDGYSFTQLSELKIWWQPQSGDVIIYFPATINFSMADLYFGARGQIDEQNGLAKYIQSAAKRNYEEFRHFFNNLQGFEIRSLKIYGHSRGAAVADLFLLLLEQGNLSNSIANTVLIRGSPLPSLGRLRDNRTFQNANIINIVLVGDEFRDPYTKIKKEFYHPNGQNIFLKLHN